MSLLKTSFKQTNVILYRAQKAALRFFYIILHSIVFSRKNFFFNCHLGFVKAKKKKKRKKKYASIFRYIWKEATILNLFRFFFFFTRISYYQYWKWNEIRKKFDRVESFSRLVSIGKWVLIYFSCRYDENTFNKYFFLIFNLKKKKHKKNRNKNVYLCLLLLF